MYKKKLTVIDPRHALYIFSHTGTKSYSEQTVNFRYIWNYSQDIPKVSDISKIFVMIHISRVQ